MNEIPSNISFYKSMDDINFKGIDEEKQSSITKTLNKNSFSTSMMRFVNKIFY